MDSLSGRIAFPYQNGQKGTAPSFAVTAILAAGLVYSVGFNVLVLASRLPDFRASRVPESPGSAILHVLANQDSAILALPNCVLASLRRNNAGYIGSRNSSVVYNHNGRNSADYSRTRRKRYKSRSCTRRKGHNHKKCRHCHMAGHKLHNHSESR